MVEMWFYLVESYLVWLKVVKSVFFGAKSGFMLLKVVKSG